MRSRSVIVELTPEYDSFNDNPSNVRFEVTAERVIIHLTDIDRTITFDASSFRAIESVRPI